MSKEQRNVPKLRFPEFKDDWEQGKVSTIITDIADGPFGSNLKTEHYTDEKEARIIQLSNLSDYGWQEENTKYTTFEHAKEIKRCIVNEGELVMGKMMPAGLTIMRPNTEKMYVLSSDCVRIKLDNDRVTDKFFLYVTKSNTFLNQINTDSQGSTRIRTSISKIREMDISLPSVTEQERIGDFFSKFDTLITLQQRKLDQIKEYKKGMLQKMFPKEGEAVPEVRFPGFTGEWEWHKCGEVAPLQRGFDLSVSQMKEGKYPVVMSNGVGGYHSDYKAKGPGIVTGRSGTLGKLHFIEENYWPHNTALWVTDFKGNYPKFIYYLYLKLDLSRFGSGSGVPTLNRNDVHDACVSVPDREEQKLISEFLTNLDTLITLHQRKLEAMKEYKKGLLQQMFV